MAEEKESFVEMIKDQLLAADIKQECCRNSFLCSVSYFSRKRKNPYTDKVMEFSEKLIKRKSKKKDFFDDGVIKGYYTENDGEEKHLCSNEKRTCKACISHFLSGAFLVSGRASLTDRGAQIEIVVPTKETAEFINSELEKCEVPVEFKYTERRGEKIIYCKKRETIENFLSYIGAFSASFYYMNRSIVKDLRCTANRAKNCDTTNIERSLAAAQRQINAIKEIEIHGEMDKLSPALKETAILRKENPTVTLDDLAKCHKGNITRSGVNHRLEKIVKYASEKGYIEKE